jgi:4Fe-4S single cluster domain/Radical SAM superfamily
LPNFLRFIGVTKDARTAGPGRRLELFTKGCIRGVINPCQGCFNEETWTFEGQYREMRIEEVVKMIDRDAWNRQVTFCGGEPILQAKGITKVAKRLKEIDPSFHIIMYTAYKLDTLMKYGLRFVWVPKYGEAMLDSLKRFTRNWSHNADNTRYEFELLSPEDVKELMTYIDIIVDGDYQQDKRLTQHETMHDGGFIGSSNQRVIFCDLTLDKGELQYLPPQIYNYGLEHHCKCCGHQIHARITYCNDLCEKRYNKRVKDMELIGVM